MRRFLFSLFLAAVLCLPAAAEAAGSSSSARTVPAVERNILKVRPSMEHVRGSHTAPIALIEYGDFECPYCKKFHAVLQQTLQDYRGTVNWTYRHFPLTAIHPHALGAAKTSECVTSLFGQNAFWAFTDAVFRDNAKNHLAIAQRIAGRKWNKDRFDACLKTAAVTERINGQVLGARTMTVNATPTTFIVKQATGEWLVIRGAATATQVKDAVQALLRK